MVGLGSWPASVRMAPPRGGAFSLAWVVSRSACSSVNRWPGFRRSGPGTALYQRKWPVSCVFPASRDVWLLSRCVS